MNLADKNPETCADLPIHLRTLDFGWKAQTYKTKSGNLKNLVDLHVDPDKVFDKGFTPESLNKKHLNFGQGLEFLQFGQGSRPKPAKSMKNRGENKKRRGK